jgi:nucleoside-diphosphate-sugar epimerase
MYPVVRELLEMQYQFEEPFIVDSSKITKRLGVTATPLDQAISETLLSYSNEKSPTA